MISMDKMYVLTSSLDTVRCLVDPFSGEWCYACHCLCDGLYGSVGSRAFAITSDSDTEKDIVLEFMSLLIGLLFLAFKCLPCANYFHHYHPIVLWNRPSLCP